MSCEEVRNRLASGEPIDELREHLESCEDCQALAQRLQAVDQALSSLADQQPPPQVVQRTIAGVRQASEEKKPGFRPWMAAAATAGVAVLALAVVLPLTLTKYEMSVGGRAEAERFAANQQGQIDALKATERFAQARTQTGHRMLDFTTDESGRWWHEGLNARDSGGKAMDPAPGSSVNLPLLGEDSGVGSESTGYYQKIDELEHKVKELREKSFKTKARLALLPEPMVNDGKDIDGDDDGRPDHGWTRDNRGPAPSEEPPDETATPKVTLQTKTTSEKQQAENKKEDKGERELDRSLVANDLKNADQLASSARIVPHMRNGKPDGFKVYGVRDGSMLDQAGIENGDVIRSVDGQPLNSPDKALELYSKVQDKDKVEIEVERRGRNEKLTVRLSDRAEVGALARVDSPAPDTAKVGQIKIDSDPHGGQVFLDGNAVSSGAKIPVQAGKVNLRFQRQGHASIEQTVEVPAGRTVTLKPPTTTTPTSGEEEGEVSDEVASKFAFAVSFEDDDEEINGLDEKRRYRESDESGKRGERGKAGPAKGRPLPDALDKQVVLATIQRGMAKMRRCAEECQVAGARVPSRIVFQFDIQPSGSTSGVTVDAGATPSPCLQRCLQNEIQTWRYPAFSGQPIRVKMPWNINPSGLLDAPAFEDEDEYKLADLKFIPAQGYFASTYLPGDSQLEWLRRSLDSRLMYGDRELQLERSALPYAQPFDPPESDGMAVYLSADRAAIEGPTRLTLQIGLKGSQRHARRRAPLNAALVVDLRALPADPDRRILWSLADALASDLQAGDRFSLLVAGASPPLQVQARHFTAASVRRALARAFEAREAHGDSDNLTQALAAAFDSVSGAVDQDSPLGASVVLLATAAPRLDHIAELETLVHQRAIQGASLTAIGVGATADADGLARLALTGQGRRRLVADIAGARPVLEQELAASGRVVARAVRLRIRLAEGVKLISVLGSHPLAEERVVRVKAAELAIDTKVSRTLGIEADRGDDEDGIQIVIPAYYAGDDHVILLDVVAEGPGPLADVRVRYKDLVNLNNAVARASLALPAGERAAGPLSRNVEKNVLAHRISESLSQAATLLQSGDAFAAGLRIEHAARRIARLKARAPEMNDDPELAHDEAMLAEYGTLLADAAAWASDLTVHSHLVRSLTLAGRVKLPPGDRG